MTKSYRENAVEVGLNHTKHLLALPNRRGLEDVLHWGQGDQTGADSWKIGIREYWVKETSSNLKKMNSE